MVYYIIHSILLIIVNHSIQSIGEKNNQKHKRFPARGFVEHGKILREARLRAIQGSTAHYGFPIIFEGHDTLAINMRGSGDLGEHIRNRVYMIGYCYIDNLEHGEIYTYVTLYSESIDVAEIAQRFGGGGHTGAAGFHFKRKGHPFPPQAKVDFK